MNDVGVLLRELVFTVVFQVVTTYLVFAFGVARGAVGTRLR